MTKEQSQRFSKFMDWIFYAALAFSSMKLVNSADKAQESISSLNERMGIIAERTLKHEEMIHRQDDRIRFLERATK